MALLTLAEAKAQLNITTDTNDVELLAYIEALTAVIEGHVGPVEEQEVTETVDGQGRYLALLKPPVKAIIAIVPIMDGGTPLDPAGLHLDGPSGVMRRTDGRRFSGGPWTVTYTAGRGEIPPTINVAARILLQHLWRTQLGQGRGGVLGSSSDFSVNEPIPGFGYAVPNRVLQLLEPYKQPPGVA
ncbi:phage gp6-like head-tail connector protein [Streptomyces sp. NBC_01754]|uniref:head-tail connector protein n=1 Tax=Streptomyces sp. NBC_01754 TaxID=2975930 RepID=UPI002DDA1747|nr:head-tail connector protein [Streptomyces sp. NBC_01754]WSC95220.1 phage gp6-like head-tail connector protein [Streptomyces sp. NBC_01754]